MSDKEYAELKNVLASTRMEGYVVTEQTERDCSRLMLGVAQLIRAAGYDIDWAEADTDLLMLATIQSANGVTDLLRKQLSEAIH